MSQDNNISGRKVKLHDMCLRDGMHSMRHQITLDQMIDIATGLDEAGVPLLQVTHGDGLGGSSLNYGRGLHTDKEYITAVASRMKNAVVSVLHVPGFLMMAHMTPVEALVEQALLMESYGATTVYCTDSAGYMLPEEVTARIGAMRAALQLDTEIGFHGHHNLGMGVANSVAAVAAGATRIDGSAAGLGAGAGNTPLELFAAVGERMGMETGIDVFKLMDVAEDRVLPMMPKPPRADRDSLTLGYAGVYSTFLYAAKDCERKYGLPARDLLVELGRLKMIGGQEDMIEDTALTMAKERGLIGHNSQAPAAV